MSVSRVSNVAARIVTAIGLTMILAVIATDIARTQTANDQQQLTALRQQVAELDRRVKELEKSASNASSTDDTTAGGRMKALEQKVGRLESALQARDAGTAGELANKRVTAPFSIVDHAGKVLMKITEGGEGQDLSRGAYLFDASEKIVAHIGGNTTGGRMYATRNGQLPIAMLAAGEDTGLFLRGDGQKVSTMIQQSSITFLSDSGHVLSVFGTKNRSKGYLELNDGSGTKMVEAGMLDSRKGYVMASPYRVSVGPNGNPSVLMGGAGR